MLWCLTKSILYIWMTFGIYLSFTTTEKMTLLSFGLYFIHHMLKTFWALCIFYPVNGGEGCPSYVAGTFSVLSFYIGFTSSFSVSQGFSSSFLLCSKNMNTGLTVDSKLPLGASVSEWCVSCDWCLVPGVSACCCIPMALSWNRQRMSGMNRSWALGLWDLWSVLSFFAFSKRHKVLTS